MFLNTSIVYNVCRVESRITYWNENFGLRLIVSDNFAQLMMKYCIFLSWQNSNYHYVNHNFLCMQKELRLISRNVLCSCANMLHTSIKTLYVTAAPSFFISLSFYLLMVRLCHSIPITKWLNTSYISRYNYYNYYIHAANMSRSRVNNNLPYPLRCEGNDSNKNK